MSAPSWTEISSSISSLQCLWGGWCSQLFVLCLSSYCSLLAEVKSFCQNWKIILKWWGPSCPVLVSFSSSSWAVWKGNLFSTYLSESAGFKQLSVFVCFYIQGRESLFICHSEEMLRGGSWEGSLALPPWACLDLMWCPWQSVLDVNSIPGRPLAHHLSFCLVFSKCLCRRWLGQTKEGNSGLQ